jgi:pimeloyl-ACP methyl ester carboxylesterase
MPFFRRDDLEFHYRQQGEGLPFVFQHGLGGDANQPFGLFTPPAGFRLLTLDCRGHGEKRPLGDLDKLSYASFADDVCALLDQLQLPQVILGGISMGGRRRCTQQ